MHIYLRVDTDPLECAQRYASKAAATRAYAECAHNLNRFGQRVGATLHYGDSLDELYEYPDFVLSLGPRGGIRCERA